MSNRRWQPGMRFMAGNVPFQTIQGNKGGSDTILEWYANGKARRVPMEVGFVLADFFHENEDELYPSGLGGEMYHDWCTEAAEVGWQIPAARLQEQREARAAREAQQVKRLLSRYNGANS